MTQILVERATIEQALEALEYYRSGEDYQPTPASNAITALKAALAQKPEPVNVAGLSIAAQSTIGRWLNEDMDRAVANGANSISMPDELVEIAAWLHALAEPAQQPEPVCKCDLRTRLVGDGCEVCNPRLAAEFAQQAEPAQEPVGWMNPANGECISKARREAWERDYGLGGKGNAARFTVALGPIRAQRPPLTEGEIAEATAGVLGLPHEIKVELARAIERKVRGE